MKEVKIILPEFLEEVTRICADLNSCESEYLLQTAAKARAVCQALSQNTAPSSPVAAILSGLRFYLPKMEEELSRRNIYLIDINDIVDKMGENQELVAEVLESYPLLELIQLENELQKKIEREHCAKDSPWQIMHELVCKELCSRTAKTGVLS